MRQPEGRGGRAAPGWAAVAPLLRLPAGIMLDSALLLLAALVLVLTLLPIWRARWWWVRLWDFPRVQLAVVGSVTLALLLWRAPEGATLLLWALAAAVAFHLGMVWRYTPLAPVEAQRSREGAPGRCLSLVMANVLQTNRESERLLGAVRKADPDVILLVETDAWWAERATALRETHPHTLLCPLDNTYGMLLYSRRSLEDGRIEFLVEPDIPSMRARVRLDDGTPVLLRAVHPRPPAPGESSSSLPRDAELLVVGREVEEAREPVVVFGDLNDVAWSRTTRLFQKVSRLLDPRKGRGLFSTFHARLPLLRWPLDHVFHDRRFRLVQLRRLDYVGSDHFPVHVTLSLEPEAGREQEAPTPDGEDLREAAETVREVRDTGVRRPGPGADVEGAGGRKADLLTVLGTRSPGPGLQAG